MKAVIYKNLEPALLKEWHYLWKNSPAANYTNSPQWFLSVIDTFKYKKYTIIGIYQSEKLIAIAALIKQKRYGIDFYTTPPTDYVYGLPFIVDLKNSEEVLFLKKQLLQLGNIFLTNMTEEFITAVDTKSKDVDSFVQAFNYYLPISFDSNGLVKLHKRNKLLHEIRGIDQKFTLLAFDGNSKGLETVFALDSLSRKQDRGYSAFSDDTIRKFYKNLGKNFKEHMQIHILYFEEKPIAYEIGFLIGDTYFGSQIAYMSDYRQYSPGKVILVKVIDLLASKGIKMMNMGSGDSPVKKLVTEEKRTLYEVILSQNTISRTYIKNAGKLKKNIYSQLHSNTKVYSAYRKMRKLLH